MAAALCLQPACAGDWEGAQAAFADCDAATGLRLLEPAGGQGDVRAMQGWGLALLHGRRLFPTLVSADPKLAARWFDMVAKHSAHVQVAQAEGPCQQYTSVRLTKRCLAHAAHGSAQCAVALAAL